MRRFNPKHLTLARLIDPLLGILALGWRRFGASPPGADAEVWRIIVFEFFFLGDLIMATPALRALRRRFSRAEIVLLAPTAAVGLKRNLPWIDRLVTFDCPWSAHRYDPRTLWQAVRVVRRLRRERWDLAIELRGDLRNICLAALIGARRRAGFATTGGSRLLTDIVPYDDSLLKHQLEGNLEVVRHLGCDVSENLPELAQQENDDLAAEREFRVLSMPVIGVHPSAGRDNRLWESAKWAQLVDRLVAEFEASIVILHGPSQRDRELAREIYDRTGRKERCRLLSPSLTNLVALVRRLDLLIALDSAPSHIAAATATPFVSLFGPQTPDLTRPYHFSGRVVVKDGFPCRPCGIRCAYGIDNRCMKAITVEDVLGAARDLLARPETCSTQEERHERCAG